jgi:integral membrane protein
MTHFFTTAIGRLRLLAFVEGLSLLIIIFITMPLKYWFDMPGPTKVIGLIHGVLFVLFCLNALSISIAQKWSFTKTTWKVLLSSFIPFGTFYIDHKILRHIPAEKGV